MKTLRSIDKFYFFLAGLMVLLAIIVIFSLRSIFGALATAGEIDETLTNTASPRIDKQNLDEAYEFVTSNEVVPLDLH